MSNYLQKEELLKLGLGSCGSNVRISKDAKIYNSSKVHLASNIRIDDFCILSAGSEGIHVKSFVHIGCYSSLIGEGLIAIGMFANISSRVSIYSSNDDYSGQSMTNPMIPTEYKNLEVSPVLVGEHVIIGSNCTILPGVNIAEGTAIGAHSLVKNSCEAFQIYAGIPARVIKERQKQMKSLACQMIAFPEIE